MASSTDQSSKGVRKRMSSPDVDAPIKRIKSEDGDEAGGEGKSDSKDKSKNKSNANGVEKYNPYLAHYDDPKETKKSGNAHPKGSPLYGFSRRQTTAKQAEQAEEGDNNPFTGEPHSQQYFAILKTRRNLPVHKQR